MTLEQLRIFVGVAEREHVTRAAEALNVTQSAASGAIAALEARHGVPLFNRVGIDRPAHEAGSRPVGPDLELFDGGGAEGVAGDDHHLGALGREVGGDLAQRRGLARAIDADEQHHIGPGPR